jgi:hypothetical protein
LLADFGLERGHRGPCFVVGQENLTAGERVRQAAGDESRVNINRGFLQTLTHVHSDGVAGFVFVGFENR